MSYFWLYLIYAHGFCAYRSFEETPNMSPLGLIISYILCSCFPPFIPVDVSVDVKSLFFTLFQRQIQNQNELQLLINKGLEACYADDRVPDVRWASARHRPERQRRPWIPGFKVSIRKKPRNLRSGVWCGWQDLNLHASRHKNLNLACLPIPSHPQLWNYCRFLSKRQ